MVGELKEQLSEKIGIGRLQRKTIKELIGVM